VTSRKQDEFSDATRHHLARSVNYHCSKCSAPTAAPYSGGGKSITTGIAAHICAAAPAGPRYDPNMTPSQRRHYDNGIWLCAAHAPLVDQDWPRYTVEELKAMKQRAEAKAAADLDLAAQQARLEPILDGQIEWHAPAANETRPGFQGLHHAVFRIGGTRKQRGRVYLDLDVGEPTPRRAQACIGEGTEYLAHEFSTLRPGQPYTVPAFTTISTTSKFWLDRRFVPDHPFWTEPAIATLRPGTYLTDKPFLDQVHRQPLPPGTYRLRVVAILGDVAHEKTFTSDWKEIQVVA
jgi:hypothetical protein